MRKLLFFAISALAAFMACTDSSSGPDTSAYPLKFTVESAPGGTMPDSMSIRLNVDGDTSQVLVYNWQSGQSRGKIGAKDGAAFRIHYEIFQCDYRIGQGDDSGVFVKNQDLILHVNWDTAALAQAKLCRLGSCVPSELKAGFDLALAGKSFEFPASCDSGATYRWSVMRGDSVLLSGQGEAHAFIIPDSLAESIVTVKFQILIDGHVTEDRVFTVKVLSKIAEGRLIRLLVKNDPAAESGSSLDYAYDSAGHLAVVATYDTLAPKSGSTPLAIDSLFYDGNQHLIRSMAYQLGEVLADSEFHYNDKGNLVSLHVKTTGSVVVDSLVYTEQFLSKSLRYVSGTLKEITVYHNLPDTVWDSVFSVNADKQTLARVIQRLYREDSLLERRVWVARNGLQPLTKEVVVYNGIGKRGYRQIFTVGQSLILEETDNYGYDSLGRLAFTHRLDEVTGNYLEADSCIYLGTPAVAKRTALFPGHPHGLDALDRVRFAAVDWLNVVPKRNRP